MEIPLGDTYYFLFTTRQFSTGAPFTLAGTPAISAYEENNLVQLTTPASVTADYDGVTGLNEAAIVCTTGNGFEVGKYYSVIIDTGTVDSVSAVGEVIGHFRVVAAENNAGEKVTDVASVAGTAQTANDNGADINAILLDTAEIGTAGAGLTNIGTIATVTTLTNLPAITANWLTAAGINADAITSAKIADDAIGADQLAASAVTQIWGHICETVGSRTAQQIMSLVLSAVAGVTDTGGIVFRDAAGTNIRISATVNGSNERTAVTLTPSA